MTMVIAVCAAAPTGRAVSGTEVIVVAAGAGGPGRGPERKRAADDSSFHREESDLTALIVR